MDNLPPYRGKQPVEAEELAANERTVRSGLLVAGAVQEVN